MYARNVTLRLKSKLQPDFTHAVEHQVLPLLQKQEGFRDEITLCNPGSPEVVSISLWDHKRNADNYNARVYPEVLKIVAKMIEGTPRVHTFETVVSTFHNVSTAV